jgi:alanine dehydrogenase
VKVLWLSRKDVEDLGIPVRDVTEVVESGFRLKGEGKVEMPAKIGIHTRKDCFIHAMPAYVGGDADLAGMKWVSGYPPNQAKGLPYITGIWCLNDSETGFLKAILDASWITAWRTGSASAVCARHLASPEARTLAVVGLGVQGRTNFAAIKDVLPSISRAQVYDAFPEQTKRFVADMAPGAPDVEFVVAPDVQSCVRDADIVVTCTPIVADPQRFIPVDWLKKDVLCISVDYDAAFEAPVMKDARIFVCDDRHQYLWTQEHGVYFQKGYPQEADLYADMGDICAGTKPPVREGRRAAVLMGIASHDVMTGHLIWRKAIEAGKGIELEL